MASSEPTVEPVKENPKKEEKELDLSKYDLTKPIPRVDRPSKEKHEQNIAEIQATIKQHEASRDLISAKIEAIQGVAKDSALGAARAEFQKLLTEKKEVMSNRGKVFDRRDALKAATDSLIKESKDAKASVKYTSVEQIDKRIKELRTTQETVSMTLTAEKKIIKEIEDLSASKKLVSQLAGKEDAIQTSKANAKDVSTAIAEANQALKEVNAKLDKQKVILDELNQKEQGSRGKIPEFIKEKDAIRAKIKDEKTKMNALRDEYKATNNEWYNYQRVVRIQKQMQYEEEKKQREDEKNAWLAEKEAEEMKKIPYEEEMALCDYLVNYLTTTYINEGSAKDTVKVAEKNDVVAVKDDPFAAFATVSKKPEENFLQMGGKKGKKQGGGKKSAKAPTKAPFQLSVDTFAQFALINLVPPTSRDVVEASIEDVKAKKAWYGTQERGAVPTAKDIVKANTKANEKLISKEAEGEKKKKGKNTVPNFDDFAPLAGAGSASENVVSTWGKKEEVFEEEQAEIAAAEEIIAE